MITLIIVSKILIAISAVGIFSLGFWVGKKAGFVDGWNLAWKKFQDAKITLNLSPKS